MVYGESAWKVFAGICLFAGFVNLLLMIWAAVDGKPNFVFLIPAFSGLTIGFWLLLRNKKGAQR